MTFEEYLESKKIDSNSFKKDEAEKWQLFKTEFDQMHPKSFTAQKLFLLNAIRRANPLVKVQKAADDVNQTASAVTTEKIKPKVPSKRPVVAGKSSNKPKMGKPVIKRPKKED